MVCAQYYPSVAGLGLSRSVYGDGHPGVYLQRGREEVCQVDTSAPEEKTEKEEKTQKEEKRTLLPH